MSTSVRRGLWLIPLAGLLTGLPWFEFIHVAPGQAHIAREEALRALSLADQIAIYTDAAGFLSLLFGLLALHALAMNRDGGMVALAAVVLDVLAVILVLSVQIGVLAVARPVAAEFYLSGHEDAGSVVLQLSGGSFGPKVLALLLTAILIALLGGLANGVATWRSGVIAGWAAATLAIGFVLTMTDFPLVGWIGSALLLAVGSAIAWGANRKEVLSTNEPRSNPASDRLANA